MATVDDVTVPCPACHGAIGVEVWFGRGEQRGTEYMLPLHHRVLPHECGPDDGGEPMPKGRAACADPRAA